MLSIPESEDPFLRFGTGLYHFFKMTNRLVLLFGVLTLFALVQMIIFRSFGSVANFKNFRWTANWSFGSMGFALNLCSKTMLDWSSAD